MSPTFRSVLLRPALLCLALLLCAPAAWAAEKHYKPTTVWSVSLISVEPGQTDAYLESLRGYYTSVMEEAIRQKLVLSYRIFVGSRSNPNDWDLMILIEGPNWASLDGLDDKFDAIAAKMAGSTDKADAQQKKEMGERAKIRTIFGGKMMQQVEFTK
jgi:hypothetical protein